MTVYDDAGGSTREQIYATNPLLAERVARLAVEASDHAHIAELGVGDGAIFARLPEARRSGVELRTDVATRFANVSYGVNALDWTPPVVCTEDVVVCNPPFQQQIAFFNHAASQFARRGDLTIVWIAGMNIRLWTNEDKLDDRMHLVSEWLVEPALSHFKVRRPSSCTDVSVKVVIQVWKRKPTPRLHWNLPMRLEGFRGVYANPTRGTLVIARTGNPTQLGKAGILGHNVWCDAPRHFALDAQGIDDNAPNATATLGTLRQGHGTAMLLSCADAKQAHAVAARLQQLRRNDAFRKLYTYRTSLTIGAISAGVISHLMTNEPESLTRPIEFYDEVRRSAWQL